MTNPWEVPIAPGPRMPPAAGPAAVAPKGAPWLQPPPAAAPAAAAPAGLTFRDFSPEEIASLQGGALGADSPAAGYGDILSGRTPFAPAAGDAAGAAALAKLTAAYPAAYQPATDDLPTVDGFDANDTTGVMGLVEAFGRGSATGVAKIAGLPTDLMNAAPLAGNIPLWAADLFFDVPERYGPMTDDPIMGSAWLNRRLGDVGLGTEGYTPSDAGERIASRVGEEIGATAVPTAGIIGGAARVGLPAIKEMGPIARTFLEPAALAPGKVAGTEAAAATAAGMGAGAAREIAPSNPNAQAWADLLGALGGVGALGVGGKLASSLGSVGRLVAGRPSVAGAPDNVKAAVARFLTDNFSGAAKLDPRRPPDSKMFADMIGSQASAGGVVPGYEATLAEATRDPGIAALEFGRSAGPAAGAFAGRRDSNVTAIDDAVSGLAPDGTPGEFTSALSTTRDTARAASTAEVQAAQTDLDAAIARLRPTTDKAEVRGEAMRSALIDAEAAAKRVEQAAWAPVNEFQEPIDISSLDEAFRALDDRQTMASGLAVPRELTSIPGRHAGSAAAEAEAEATANGLDITDPQVRLDAGLDDVDVPVRLQEITDLRSRLAAAKTEARLANDNDKARIIDQYIGAIDEFMMGPAVPEDLAPLIADAQRVTLDARERFARPETGIGAALRRGSGTMEDVAANRLPGGPDPVPGAAAFRLPAAAVPGRMLVDDQGRIGDMQAFVTEAGGDAPAMNALRDEILSRAEPVMRSGDPAAVERFLTQYGTAFDRFPQLRAEIGDVGRLRTRFNEATEADRQLQQWLTQPGGDRTIANWLSYGDENATKAAAAVINSRSPAAAVDRLMTAVGDAPRAVQGLRRAFWDYMQTKVRSRGETTSTLSGVQPILGSKFSGFMETNAAVLDRLYRDQPDQLQNLRELADGLQTISATGKGRAAGSSGTAQGMGQGVNPLLTVEGVQSRIYAAMSGRTSWTFFGTSIAGVVARRALSRRYYDTFQRVLDDALLNPETARLLLTEYNPANLDAIRRSLRLTLGSRAQDVLDLLEGRGDESDDRPDLDDTGAVFNDMMDAGGDYLGEAF